MVWFIASQIEAMRLLDGMSNQCDEIRLQNELLFSQKRDAQPLRTPAHMCVAYGTNSLEVVFHALPLSLFLPGWV
jgi:hypothetical protein